MSNLMSHHVNLPRIPACKLTPTARNAHSEIGVSHDITLKMRGVYAMALYKDANATLDDLREAVTTLEDAERIARRLFGSAHPLTQRIGGDLRISRGMLRDRETPSANA